MFLFAKGKKLQNRTLTKGEQTSLNKFRLEQAEPKNCWKLFTFLQCELFIDRIRFFSIFVSDNLYIALFSCKYFYEEEVTFTHK